MITELPNYHNYVFVLHFYSIKKQLEDDNAVIESSDSLKVIQGETLNCTGQIPVQVSCQSLLSLPEVSSSNHIFATSDQVSYGIKLKMRINESW